MALHTILGANGTIANELVPVLKFHGESIRLVSRKPQPISGAELVAANLLDPDQVRQAVQGSDVVYLVVGLTYKVIIWKKEWPVIMRNVIDACKATGAKLVFFDNVYMYGKVTGTITEETPYEPISEKGKVRTTIAQMLEDEMAAGTVKGTIARSVDFYGPGVTTKSAVGVLVFANQMKGKKAQWFINADAPRSYTYTPDAAQALYLLGTNEIAFGQVWHLPTATPPLTGRQFAQIAAQHLHAPEGVVVHAKWLLKILGFFNPFLRELNEMHYQDEFPFVFSSEKFEKEFRFMPTPYEEGIKTTAQWYLQQKK